MEDVKESRLRSWLWLLAVLPLLPCLWLGFLGDDFVALDLLSQRGWAEVVHHFAPRGYPFVRPVGWVVFQIEQLVTGGNAVLIHMLHLGLFVVAAALTGRIAARIGGASAAGWAAALALLYPARVEAFAWIAGLFDLLALVVMLGALLVLVAPPKRWRTVVLVASSFAAPFAKETGFILPLVVAVWSAAGVTGAVGRRRRRADMAAATAGAAAALAYRLFAMGTVGGYPSTNVAGVVRGVLRAPEVVFRAVFVPVNPSWSALAWIVAALTGTAALACVAVLWRADPVAKRLLAAGVTLALLGIVPVLPYLSSTAIWRHNRYLTVLGTGLALAASALSRSEGRLSRIAPAGLAAAWAIALLVNLVPWLEAARCRDVILSGIERATREPGRHRVWMDGPIDEIHGAQLLGGNLEPAVRVTFPDRDIATGSACVQRLRGEPVGPPPSLGATLHLFRFDPEGPRLERIQSFSRNRPPPKSR